MRKAIKIAMRNIPKRIKNQPIARTRNISPNIPTLQRIIKKIVFL